MNPEVARLYEVPIESQRSGAFFNTFSYPTKIDPEVVALFVATHPQPGDVVLDTFAGSGTTGVAVALCDQPTARMRALAAEKRLHPHWGARKAVLYELSPLGALLSRVLSSPPDPEEFVVHAEALCAAAEKRSGWMYATVSPTGGSGTLRHALWSEVLDLPCCGAHVTLWEAATRRAPAALLDTFRCPKCGASMQTNACARVERLMPDTVTGRPVVQRVRVPVWIYGTSGKSRWSRPPTRDDLRQIRRAESAPVEDVPTGPIAWGDLYRAGYHRGITHFHHFYSPRNLRALGALWSAIPAAPAEMQDALRLLVLSFNATHASLLARVVAKKNMPDFVTTGAQSGVLYVSGLPVEKNVFAGIRRKIPTFHEAFRLTRNSASEIRVENASSTRLDLPDKSVDFVFTDPPFGDFIPYAEVNQLNEAWLGQFTDRTAEAIISPAQGKGIPEYGRLLREVFREIARVLRPTGSATVIFHASKSAIWQSFGDAFGSSGLQVERTTILDKTQVSFKQVVSQGGTRGDAVFLLRPSQQAPRAAQVANSQIMSETILAELDARAGSNPTEAAPHRMYSRFVARCVELGVGVGWDAQQFYVQLKRRREAITATNPQSAIAS